MPASLLPALDPYANPIPQTLQQAATLIRSGKLVILPTETVYGIALSLNSPEARQRLTQLKQLPTPQGWVIHLPNAQAAHQYVPDLLPLARRLMQKAWPGPVGIQFPINDKRKNALHALLPNVADEVMTENAFTLRCPDNPITQQILEEAGVPVAL